MRLLFTCRGVISLGNSRRSSARFTYIIKEEEEDLFSSSFFLFDFALHIFRYEYETHQMRNGQ